MKLYEEHLPRPDDNVTQAKQRLLQGLWMIDTRIIPDRTFCRFIYFFPQECQFVVSAQQLHKYLILKVDPFKEIDLLKTFEIVSYKYPFSTLLVGTFVSRRLIGAHTFLKIVSHHREWF